MHSFVGIDFRIAISTDVELTATGTNFLHIAFELLQQPIIGSNRNNRHLPINQSKRPMLEFSSRISLSMNVADLLKL